MVAEEETVILLLCFVLVWLWRRRRQRRSTAIARDGAARRRREALSRRQEDELALITRILVRRHLLLAVRQRRTVWVKHRSRAFLSNGVARWDDEEWKRNFKIRPTYRFLCTQLHPHLQRRHVVRMPLSVEERVAITLWKLGTNIEYRSIAHLFGVGLSTVCVLLSTKYAQPLLMYFGNDTSGFQLEKMLRPQLMAFYIHGGFHNVLAQSMAPIYQ